MGYNLSASMMCADYRNLEREVQLLDQGGIDSYHIDIMDGCFVDNFGMGYQDIECIRHLTEKPLEIHMMIDKPEKYISILSRWKPDVAYFHPEATNAPELVIDMLQMNGMKPGIAINPGTAVGTIEELLNIVDKVLVMCVNPGHAGRALAPYVVKKIDKLMGMKQEYGLEITWDGACTEDVIIRYANHGVDSFVLGTSVLFGHEESYPYILASLKNKIGE